LADSVDCRAASRLLSVAYERRLSADEVAALQRHLDKCFMCRNFDSQLKFLHQAAQKYRTQD
jgi:predicted anti-sigma-YlaC factor YlaD